MIVVTPKLSVVKRAVSRYLFVSLLITSAVSCSAKNPNYDTALSRWQGVVQEFAQESSLVTHAKRYSDERANLDTRQINLLDIKWRSAEEDNGFATANTSAEVSGLILTFQQSYPQFVEIFATDKVGLNIGQSNLTTDFYQADEQWWQDSYHLGGKSYFGQIEYDESGKHWVIPFYTPIKDESGEIYGVIKALLDTGAIYTLEAP